MSLDQLVEHADVISLHIPLAADTQNFLEDDVIARIKPGSVLINTSRGGIADESALGAALCNGHLSGAALDVFNHEPLPLTPHLDGVPGLILTPQVAGVTQESNERVSTKTARIVIEFFNKK